MPTAEELAAADPGTDLAELARLAHEHPELRAAIAANPSTYEGLLEWLGQFGDPEVDAALARRRGFSTPPPAPPVAPAVVPAVVPALVSQPAAVSATPAQSSPDASWHEPARDIPLRWATYPLRYGMGLGLLSLALFLPPSFVAGGGILEPMLIQLVLCIAGIVMMPASVARRVGAGGILVPAIAASYLNIGGLLFSAFPVVLALTIWLLLRNRSGLAYLLLIAAAALGVGAVFLAYPLSYNMGYREVLLVTGLLQALSVVGLAWLARLIDQRTAASRAGRKPLQQTVYAPTGLTVPTGQTNTLAILALVFGVGGGLLGIVFGHMARAQIRRTGEAGWGLATAGLVLGYVGLGGLLLVGIIYVVFIAVVLN